MILCLCQRGNVRSATLMTMLRDLYGESDVIATGVETTKPETLQQLMSIADRIYVVGDESLFVRLPIDQTVSFIHINIGTDKWLHPMHPDLIQVLIKALEGDEYPRPANADWYIEANKSVIDRVHSEIHND